MEEPLSIDPTDPPVAVPAPEPNGDDAGDPPSSGTDTAQSAASGDPGAPTGDPAPEGSDVTGETGPTLDQVAATEAALGTEQPDPEPAATLATSTDPDEVVNDHGSAAAAAAEQSGS